jgi:hypothetical protein
MPCSKSCIYRQEYLTRSEMRYMFHVKVRGNDDDGDNDDRSNTKIFMWWAWYMFRITAKHKFQKICI